MEASVGNMASEFQHQNTQRNTGFPVRLYRYLLCAAELCKLLAHNNSSLDDVVPSVESIMAAIHILLHGAMRVS